MVNLFTKYYIIFFYPFKYQVLLRGLLNFSYYLNGLFYIQSIGDSNTLINFSSSLPVSG